ncbi:hypothetical protein H8B09_19655 [Paenibacillus sp. PR3]|uniref:Lipoprotein n=1 Tax=Paenibacillus terricola TaxID=2763503 RepID=A0ABR8N0X1_9BACL|nr:hypothetical protein [Paenibacillus terricola]MBD3920992.1 hypothetical protein [Paenibacillus terricola]
MLKLKLGSLFLLCIVVLSSCMNQQDTLSLKEVVDQIEVTGVDLKTPSNNQHQIELKGVLPHEYLIGINEEDGNDWESVSIYIFHSAKDQQQGTKIFKEQLKTEHATELPVNYEQKNVLIVYWSHSKENPRFDTKITSALDKL